MRAGLLRRAVGHPWARCAVGVDKRYRRREGRPPHRTLVAADLEGQRRTVGVADIDPLAVLDVDIRHAPIVDEHPVEAAVVDCDPSALVESQY